MTRIWASAHLSLDIAISRNDMGRRFDDSGYLVGVHLVDFLLLLLWLFFFALSPYG